MRREIFEENLDYISKHNAAYMNGDETFWLRMNHLGDLTRAEYRKMLGFRPSGPRGALSAENCTHEALAPNATVDWRSAGAVTNVKDQGQCGSCWAFSATGAIEGAWALARGQLVGVSEEEIVQCDTGNGDFGCNGGNMYKAFQYVMGNGGVASEATYPYLSGNGTTGRCAALFPAFQAPVATVSAFCMVKAGDEADLERAVNQQPVSVGIEADQKAFQFYGGGILPARRCGVNLDHGVLLVGYGYERDSNASLSMKYWTVKNSWGPGWGDDGYIRLEKFPASVDHSTCGIALDASYPIV